MAANVTSGFRTGFGGVARMEVSDPTGADWAGTPIHESIAARINTCMPGQSACPNTSGEGGAAGSTFNVGDPANGLGVNLPAMKNSFYDFHMIGLPHSVLHQNNLQSCEQMCEQRFDCGGRPFGPTFEIRRTMSRAQIVAGGNPVDVSQVQLDKPEKPGLGDYPERILPEGLAFA